MSGRVPASAILLDAMGTLLYLAPPAPRLRALLAERHGVTVTQAQAATAMRAEIVVYRREHLAATTRPALDALRLRCATVMCDALPPSCAALEPGALVATLLDSLHFVAYPEVADVLVRLRASGHRLAVVSNWDISLPDVLAATGLRDHVDAVVASAGLGSAKPDPAPFARALAELGAPPSSAWHVGDTVAEDVIGARAAGVRPVLVVRDGTGPLQAGDVPVLRDLTGLPDLVA